MRKVYTKVIEEAFKAGVIDAWGFWHMVPRQINGIMAAHAFKAQHEAESRDAVAWMTGYYVTVGRLTPKEYPNNPCIIGKVELVADDMDEDDMKDRLTAFAEIHNAIEGVTP